MKRSELKRRKPMPKGKPLRRIERLLPGGPTRRIKRKVAGLRAPGTPARTDRGTRRSWNSTLPASRKPMKVKGKPRFKKGRCRPYLDWLTTLPCCVTGLRPGQWFRHPTLGWIEAVIDPAHVRTRGAGHPDLYNAAPLVRHLHDEQHAKGPSHFAAKHGVDLQAVADALTGRFLHLHPEFAVAGEPAEPPTQESA